MVNAKTKCCPWRSSYSSSSLRLLSFMIPLLLLAGLISVFGPKVSFWLPTEPLLFSSANPSPSSTQKLTQGLLDLSSTQVVVVDDALSKQQNAISDPPLSSVPELRPALQPSNKTEETLDVDTEISAAPAPLDGSYVPVMRQSKPRKNSNILDRTEAGLLHARSATRRARNGNQTQDPDYVPIGPTYHNANAFHRSYLEMEKQFKVFVYEEGEPPVFHNGPCKSIYAMEGNFIHAIQVNDQFRTRDPQKAHVFFLPYSVTMLVRFIYVRDSRDFAPIRKTVTDYVNIISSRYPFWNRSLGADHFSLACHDWGPETSFSIPCLYKNSIRALCNANTSEGFNPAKDVSIPEINLQTGSLNGFIGGPSASKRPILAFFAGGVHGPVRPVLLDHWEDKDDDIKVHRYLPRGVSYYEMLRKSKYCLCPSGYEVASPRVVEAIYTGCVPVLISEHYVPPFSDVLNWKSFSVEVSVEEIPNLKNILMSISSRQYIRMQRRVGQIRRHFEVHYPPKRFDVFHMTLHSVWLRRLNIRVRHHQ